MPIGCSLPAHGIIDAVGGRAFAVRDATAPTAGRGRGSDSAAAQRRPKPAAPRSRISLLTGSKMMVRAGPSIAGGEQRQAEAAGAERDDPHRDHAEHQHRNARPDQQVIGGKEAEQAGRGDEPAQALAHALAEDQRGRYWHQPSVGLASHETAQLPTLLQVDSSALRTVCFQSQLAQPASISSKAIGTRRFMAGYCSAVSNPGDQEKCKPRISPSPAVPPA